MTNDPLTFCFISDIQSEAGESAIATAVKALNPDLILCGGDYNYPSGAEETWETSIVEKFPKELEDGKLLFAMGNHDRDTASGLAHVRHFGYPGNGKYFTHEVKNCLFGIVNTGLKTGAPLNATSASAYNTEPDGIDFASKQYNYFKAALSQSTATFKFLIGHHSGYHVEQGYYPGYTALQSWNMKALGVSAYLHGHSHIYAENIVNGFLWLNCGLGSSPRDVMDNLPDYCRYATSGVKAFLHCSVDKFNARFRLLDESLNELRAFTLNS